MRFRASYFNKKSSNFLIFVIIFINFVVNNTFQNNELNFTMNNRIRNSLLSQYFLRIYNSNHKEPISCKFLNSHAEGAKG